MNNASELSSTYDVSERNSYPPPGASSAVSWGAILAGAAAAAALSLILLILGTGLGLSTVSPWSRVGISANTFGLSTILWLTVTQLVAAGLGGYLAGRLRTKWVAVHTDEVYFRDTAHGFLAWAVGTLATATLLASAIGSIVDGGIQAGAAVAGGIATTASVAAVGGAAQVGADMAKSDGTADPLSYFIDSLFRQDINAMSPKSSTDNLSAQSALANNAEVSRIFMSALRSGSLPAEDLRYVGQVVSQRTGLTQADAEKRVGDAYLRLQTKLHDAEVATKEAVDHARKASSYAALWLFISLLIGAFIASFSATIGGRQRDL